MKTGSKLIRLYRLSIFVLFFSIYPQAFGAWGVSESSVKKWENEKLCARSGELELKEDWEAVAIITKEIARRSDLIITFCEEQAELASAKKTKSNIKKSVRLLPDKQQQVTRAARLRGLDKFGVRAYQHIVQVVCKNEEVNSSLIQNYQNYTAASVPSRDSNLRHIVANGVYQRLNGVQEGLALAAAVIPNLCSDEGVAQLNNAVALFVDRARSREYTQQDLDKKFEVGQSMATISAALGKPVLTKEMPEMQVLHYCRTNEFNEYLVLYFFKESLLYEQRYAEAAGGVKEDGDCADYVGKGSYKVPEAINLIVKSAVK